MRRLPFLLSSERVRILENSFTLEYLFLPRTFLHVAVLLFVLILEKKKILQPRVFDTIRMLENETVRISTDALLFFVFIDKLPLDDIGNKSYVCTIV